MRLTAGMMRQTGTEGSRRSRGGIAAMAGAGVILLAAGCGSSGGPAAGGPVAETVTVGAVPGVDNVPLFLASRTNLFEAAGLTVDIKKYSSVNAEEQALVSGHIDVAAGDYGPFLFAESQQSQQKAPGLRIISDSYDATSGVLEVLALPGSGITSPQNLEGKHIAAPQSADLPTPTGTPDSLATAATTSVLRSYGDDMATVTWDPMSQSQEVSALRQHLVQAILVTEPYIYEAESQLGAVEVLDACSGATAGLPLSGYFATNSWSSRNGTALADFKSALDKAQASAGMAGPVQNLLPGYTGMTQQEAAVVTVGSYPVTTDVADLQRVSQLMSDEGMLSNPVAIGNLIIH
jgi:NitT/TauT family transport system substrate-binding protein